MEQIVQAAILFRNVYISGMTVPHILLSGHRHPDCFEAAFKMHLTYDRKEITQGFMTDTDRFIDRYEAKKLAVANDQFVGPDDNCAELYSEDLW